MELLRSFWDAARTLDPEAPDEARVLRFGRPGELTAWLVDAGFHNVTETNLTVTSTYADFDELWTGFTYGIGPAGSYCCSLSDDAQAALRGELFHRLASPRAPFTLRAVARSATGRRKD